MKRFIFTERGGIYIIDLQQTLELLEEAHDFARNIAPRGGSILFVGTKKQSQDAIAEHAARVGMPYVNHRWLGGLLTNWRTMSEPDRPPARAAPAHATRTSSSCSRPRSGSRCSRELEKLEANLGGVADMRRQPDAVFIVDLRKEQLAVREARRLGLPVDRARRHELRPGRGRLRDPGQRRRDPLVQPGRPRDRGRHRRRARPAVTAEEFARPARRPPTARPRPRRRPSSRRRRWPRPPSRSPRPPEPRRPRPPSPRRPPSRRPRPRPRPPSPRPLPGSRPPTQRRRARRERGGRRVTEISAALVKELRDLTGAGMMDCKRALAGDGRRHRGRAHAPARARAWRRRASAPAAPRPRARSAT